MCSNTKKLLVYPIWHPGKNDFGLIAKEDVFLCSTYYKGMEMHGYRPYIMEYEEETDTDCNDGTDRPTNPGGGYERESLHINNKVCSEWNSNELWNGDKDNGD